MISLTSPVKTRGHNWPASLKLSMLCCVTFSLFFVENVIAQAVFFLFVILLYALPGYTFLASGLKPLKLLFPFILIVAVWHIWTAEIEIGAVVILRMLSAVALANLVTMTTRLSDMIDVVRYLTSPFKKIGLRTETLELAIALVIRMTPTLVVKGANLSEAWRSRSRKSPGWRIILPFTVLALDDADNVAEALCARGGLINMEKK